MEHVVWQERHTCRLARKTHVSFVTAGCGNAPNSL